MSETLILHTRGVTGTDGDGNDVYGDSPVPSDGWAVAPRTSSELVQGQDTVIVGVNAIKRAYVAAAAVDEVTVSTGPYAGRYTVDGLPGFYDHPLTGTQVTELHLTKVTG
jgi:hypothetical protein